MIFVTRYSFITAILLSNLFFLFFIGLFQKQQGVAADSVTGICVAGGGVAGEASIPDRGGKHNRNQFLSDLSCDYRVSGKKLFTIGGFVVQVRWLLLAVW